MSSARTRCRGNRSRTILRGASLAARAAARRTSRPTRTPRVLGSGVETERFVCRGSYRPTELEFRIACELTGTPYRPLPIREALRGPRDFYRARLAELDDPDLLIENDERTAYGAPNRAALGRCRARLAIAPVGDS